MGSIQILVLSFMVCLTSDGARVRLCHGCFILLSACEEPT
jgi:hypothetical protein